MKNPFLKEKKSGLSNKAKLALGAAGLLLFIIGVRRSSDSSDEWSAAEDTIERDPLL